MPGVAFVFVPAATTAAGTAVSTSGAGGTVAASLPTAVLSARRRRAPRPHRCSGTSSTPPGRESPLDELQRRLDLADVIRDAGVILEPVSGGAYYRGLCPFHSEKTPSFTVSPDRGTYHCFGCGVKGGAFQFIQHQENLDGGVLHAARFLAERYGHMDLLPRLRGARQVPMDPEQAAQMQKDNEERRQLLAAMSDAADFFRTFFTDQPAAVPARRYLADSRGLSDEIVELFKLGLAPLQWDRLVSDIGVDSEILVKAGLARFRENKEKGVYDFFRGRITIPIRDKDGKVLAFGSRIVPDLGDPTIVGTAKYINSPESPIFNKSNVLFGAYEMLSNQPRGPPPSVVLVEGYLDVIALHQSGVTNVLAVLGTSLTINQLISAARMTTGKKIVINFDGDEAGRQAMRRVARETLHQPELAELEILVASFPDASKDPDEFLASHSGEEYKAQLIDAALPWEEWCLRDYMQDLRPKSVDAITRAIDGIAQLVHKIMPSASERHKTGRILYARMFAAEVAASDSTLATDEFVADRVIDNIAKLRNEYKSQANGYPVRNIEKSSYSEWRKSNSQVTQRRKWPKPIRELTTEESQTITNEINQHAWEEFENTFPTAQGNLESSVQDFLSALILCPSQRVRAVDVWLEKELSFHRREYNWLFEQIAESDLPPDELYLYMSKSGGEEAQRLPLVEHLFTVESRFTFPIRNPVVVVDLCLASIERYWCEVKRLRINNEQSRVALRIAQNNQMVRSMAVEAGSTMREVCKEFEEGRRGEPGELVDRCWSLLEQNVQDLSRATEFTRPMNYYAERAQQAQRLQKELQLEVNRCDRSLGLPKMDYVSMKARQALREANEEGDSGASAAPAAGIADRGLPEDE